MFKSHLSFISTPFYSDRNTFIRSQSACSNTYPLDQLNPLPPGGDFFLRKGYDGDVHIRLSQVSLIKRSKR